MQQATYCISITIHTRYEVKRLYPVTSAPIPCSHLAGTPNRTCGTSGGKTTRIWARASAPGYNLHTDHDPQTLRGQRTAPYDIPTNTLFVLSGFINRTCGTTRFRTPRIWARASAPGYNMHTDHHPHTLQGQKNVPCDICTNTLFLPSGNTKPNMWHFGGQKTKDLGASKCTRLQFAYQSLSAYVTGSKDCTL